MTFTRWRRRKARNVLVSGYKDVFRQEVHYGVQHGVVFYHTLQMCSFHGLQETAVCHETKKKLHSDYFQYFLSALRSNVLDRRVGLTIILPQPTYRRVIYFLRCIRVQYFPRSS